MTEHTGAPIEADERCACKHCTYARMRDAGIPMGRGLLPGEFARVVPMYGPSVDPVPAHVTKAAARYDKRIAEAESEVDVLLDTFTTADAAWIEALRAEVASNPANAPILVSADWSRHLSDPERESKKESAKRQVTTTFEAREEAAYELRKARIKLQKLTNAQRYAARQARELGPSGIGAIKAKLRA